MTGAQDNAGRNLPRWRCHKEVWAVKIRQIVVHAPPEGGKVAGGYIFPDKPDAPWLGPIEVSAEYLTKHDPHVGGYYVVYGDNYCSYSPAPAFEEGYSRL